MMDDMIYTYVATYFFSRLAIIAAVGSMFFMILRPKTQPAHLQK